MLRHIRSGLSKRTVIATDSVDGFARLMEERAAKLGIGNVIDATPKAFGSD